MSPSGDTPLAVNDRRHWTPCQRSKTWLPCSRSLTWRFFDDPAHPERHRSGHSRAAPGTGLGQDDPAKRVRVSRQWIIEAEKGKPRLELGLVLRTLDALGLALRTDDTSVPGSAAVTPVAAVDLQAVIEAHRERPKRKP